MANLVPMKRSFPWAAVLVALLLRVFLACATPTGFEARSRGLSWYNDERAHINYVRHLALHRSFPVQTNSVQVPGSYARGDFEYYQPPLAYIAMVPAWMLGETVRPGSGWLFARLLDALFGVAAVLVAWRIVRRWSPEGANWAAWLLALQPGLCFQGVLASNDPLFWLLGALFLLETPDLGEGRSPWMLAPLAGALLLTKSSGLMLLPLPFLALLPALRGDGFHPRRFLQVAAAIGVGVLLAFPWYLRAHHVYGSWMALEVGHGAPYPVGGTLANHEVLKSLLIYFSTSFWYPMDLDWSVHSPVRVLFGLASLAWIAPLAVSWRRFRSAAAWIFWAAILLGLSSMVLYAVRYRQSEARLLFHLLPAFVALWAVAARPRLARWGALALAPSVLVWGWVFFAFFRSF